MTDRTLIISATNLLARGFSSGWAPHELHIVARQVLGRSAKEGQT